MIYGHFYNIKRGLHYHSSMKKTIMSSSAVLTLEQESSAKLTNQRVSYAFISSPFNFHACQILPASNFQYSYSCILLIYENCECEYSPLV